MTVGLVILLLESATVKSLQTIRASEVLRVELFVHGCDAATSDWLVTRGTQRSTLGVIVCLTVGEALMVVETARSKWHTAVLSHNVNAAHTDSGLAVTLNIICNRQQISCGLNSQ